MEPVTRPVHELTASEVIERLGLQPHPEGGHYVQTFRDPEGVGGRPHSSAILFLLAAGEVSAWHRVDAVEVWHWHAGAPIELRVWNDAGSRLCTTLLCPELLAGQQPQAVVPKGAWQTARSLGPWTLVGCTVAPAFEFRGFELAPPGWEPASD